MLVVWAGQRDTVREVQIAANARADEFWRTVASAPTTATKTTDKTKEDYASVAGNTFMPPLQHPHTARGPPGVREQRHRVAVAQRVVHIVLQAGEKSGLVSEYDADGKAGLGKGLHSSTGRQREPAGAY